MNQLFYGSICVTDLLDKLKAKHSGFTKGRNGKIYASANVWLNENVDEYGNILSVQITPSKERKDSEQKFYVGNFKKSEGSKPISDADISGIDTNVDLPQATPKVNSDIEQTQTDDLPF